MGREEDSRRPRSRVGGSAPADGSGRAKVAALLEQGEEHFRAGRFEQAIHLWTRILFLERGHVEARRSIEKAKRALAERQRQLDAAVAEAARRLEAGRRRAARTVVEQVLALDPRHVEARLLREKLDALERRGETGSRRLVLPGRPVLDRRSARPPRATAPAAAGRASSLKMAAFLFSALCLFAAGGLYLHLNWEFLVEDRDLAPVGATGIAPTATETLPVPTPEEMRYYNGARLYAEGRYREALVELARVPRGAPHAEAARSLILQIEQRLLRAAMPLRQARPEETQ